MKERFAGLTDDVESRDHRSSTSEPKTASNIDADNREFKAQRDTPVTLGISQYPPHNLRFFLAICSICLVCLNATVDLVILASALPVITRELGGTSAQPYWSGTAFLLAQSVSQPIYGAFQEIVGHKQCMLAAIAIFGLSSILCATAHTMPWLIAARAIQGIGGGGANAMVNVLVSDLTSLKDRGIYTGVVQLTAAIGLVAGIVLGAVFAETMWRLIFYINIPICLISACGILFCVHLPNGRSRNSTTLLERLQTLDVGGVIIISGSLLALLLGVTTGGVLYPWNSARVVTPLVIGVAGIAGFVKYEATVPALPMIPVRIFKDRTVASGFFTAWVHGVALISLAYYLILYYLITRQHSLLHSSLEVVPGLATIPVFAAVTGVLMSITSQFKYFNLASWVFLSCGIGALSTLNLNSSLASSYGFQILLAVGAGGLYPGRVLAVQAPLQLKTVLGGRDIQQIAPNGDPLPIATTLVSVFTSLGNAFGVGLGGTVAQNEWSRRLEGSNLPLEYLLSGKSLEAAARVVPSLPEEARIIYQDILADGLRTLWIFSAGLCGVGFLVTLLQQNLKLDGETNDSEALQHSQPKTRGVTGLEVLTDH